MGENVQKIAAKALEIFNALNRYQSMSVPSQQYVAVITNGSNNDKKLLLFKVSETARRQDRTIQEAPIYEFSYPLRRNIVVVLDEVFKEARTAPAATFVMRIVYQDKRRKSYLEHFGEYVPATLREAERKIIRYGVE